MATFGIIQQGNFTADGSNKLLNIRSDVDWIKVYNLRAAANVSVDMAYEFYFQRGMTSGTGMQWTILGATLASDPVTVGLLTAPNGFTLINDGLDPVLSSGNAAASFTNVTQPVVTTGVTWSAALSDGDVVRFSQTAAEKTAGNLSAWAGIDFQVSTVVANTSFVIANALEQAPGGSAASSWRKVNTRNGFYPLSRYIANIAKSGSSLVVTTTVDHGYKVGQEVQFNVRSALNGMVELNGLQGSISAVTASTFTVSIDGSTFSDFIFPTLAQAAAVNAYTPAQVVPVGMDSPVAINAGVDLLSDATNDLQIVGVLLGGANSSAVKLVTAGPAGHLHTGGVGDTLFWVAGSSANVSNETSVITIA